MSSLAGLTFTLSSSDGPLSAQVHSGSSTTLVILTFTTNSSFNTVNLTMPYNPEFVEADQSAYLNPFLQGVGGLYLGQPYSPFFTIAGISQPVYLSLTAPYIYQAFPLSQGGDSERFPILAFYSPGANWGPPGLAPGLFSVGNFPPVNGNLTLTLVSGGNGNQMLYSPSGCTGDCGFCGSDYCAQKDPLNLGLFDCNGGICQANPPVSFTFSIQQQIPNSTDSYVLTYTTGSSSEESLFLLPYFLPASTVPAISYPTATEGATGIFAPQSFWFFVNGESGLQTGITYPIYIFDQFNQPQYLEIGADGEFIGTPTAPTATQLPNFFTFTPSLAGNWESFIFPPSDFNGLNQFFPANVPGNTATTLSTSSPLGLWTLPSIPNPAVSGPNLPTLTITPSTLPSGIVGNQYSQPLIATPSVTAPPNTVYTWSISNGNLPNGLTLNPSTGLLSGIPLTAGTSTFTVNVNDNNGSFGTITYSNVLINSAGGNNGGGTGGTGGTGSNDNVFANFPWWAWLIIGVVVFLLLIMIIGFFLRPKASPEITEVPLTDYGPTTSATSATSTESMT